MSATLTYRPENSVHDFSSSRATSDVVLQMGCPPRAWLEEARFLHGKAVEELQDTFLDCRSENWDGYEAQPVRDITFIRARNLLHALLGRFPVPTASATPYGSLTLEWIYDSSRRFIVSVGPEEQIAFAGIFGSETLQGVASFVHDVPAEVTRQLGRLFYYTA